MACVTLRAPAKLNLHLGIHDQLDERRYHRADSLMVALDLADEVMVEARDNEALHSGGTYPLVECHPALDIPAEQNTAYRAAVLMAELANRGPLVRISLSKRVPDQAGMGGSSSDAAAVIKALCLLWDLDVRDAAVAGVAQRVGADVPFFLDPVPTLLGGAGDVVAEKFPAFASPLSVVLVRPEGPGVSTPAAYAAFDKEHEAPIDPAALCEVLRGGRAQAQDVAPLLANNLDPVACRLLPSVGEVRAWLLGQPEVLGGQVTGSGSCVFGLCADDVSAERVARNARMKFEGWAKSAHIV